MGESVWGQKSDSELIVAFKEGNDAAFEELIKRHKEKSMNLAYVTLGNYEDAKEVSQDAFVKAYKSLKSFEMRSQFKTWFYKILMNTARDFLRKKKWQRFLKWKDQDEMDNYFETLGDRSASPFQGVSNRELGSKITEAIAVLPEKQKWIFTLRYIEGLSIQEIAQSTDLSEGTVKAALHFAGQKFKEKMTPYLRKGV